jgi:hypothetical protein
VWKINCRVREETLVKMFATVNRKFIDGLEEGCMKSIGERWESE